MISLDRSTFVLQRRINRPPTMVLRTIGNAAVFGPGSVLSDDENGSLRLDGAFRRVDGYPYEVWRADARLLGARREIAAIEVEISAWSDRDSEVLIRPRSRHPERWSGRKLKRYFGRAHRSADDLMQLLTHTTPETETSDIRVS